MKSLLIVSLYFISISCAAQTSPKKSIKTGGTKYGVVFAFVNEPEYVYSGLSNLDMDIAGSRYVPKLKTYVSKVLTITNCTQEKVYRLKDEFRYNLEDDLRFKNMSRSDEGKCYISSIELYTYNTYKEASDARNK